MREVGIYVSGVTAVFLALTGVWCLALTGLVWVDGQLRETTSFDPSEASIGSGMLWVTWIIAGGLLVFSLVAALRGAHCEQDRRGYYIALATLLPLGSVVLVAVGWFILLAPGDASFAP